MWGRSGIERSSLNSKPDSVKINVPLRKLREVEDEIFDGRNKKYKLTPRSSLRFTSRHVRKTFLNLNKEASNIFVFPKSAKDTHKLKVSSGNSTITGTSNAKNVKTSPRKTTKQIHKPLEKDAQIKPKLDETKRKLEKNRKLLEGDTQLIPKLTEKKDKAQRLKIKNKKDNSVDFERMFRLGLALDWNHNTSKVSDKDRTRNESLENEASAPDIISEVIGNFDAELDSMKSHFMDQHSKNKRVVVDKLKKSSLENGWINHGNQRNCQLPHPFMCPFEETVEDKFGRIDGFVTLESLMEYAYESKEKAKIPCAATSRGRHSAKKYSLVNDMSSTDYQDTEEPLTKNGLKPVCGGEEKLNMPLNIGKINASENDQQWMEKANRWASRKENLNDLTDEEKLTRAWKESLARWKAEKKDLLAEASTNHYALGKRFQTQFQSNSDSNLHYASYHENTNDTMYTLPKMSCPSKKRRRYPIVMSKGDIKAFCFHWDQATEPIRNTLVTKFLKLYSEWEDPLPMDEVLNGGANLLFMRFAFGFKVSFIKKCRCWRYIECILIFLQSLENAIFAKQLLEINILEDILELVRYDESYLFDKLQGLYFLSTLLEGPIGKEVIRVISCSGKLMDLLLQFFVNCEDPQTLVLCRNILLIIINGTDLSTSQVILEAISHFNMNDQTSLKIELIFQVIKSFLCMHPVVINNCGPFIMQNLNTKDLNILLGIGELAATMTGRSQCSAVIKDIFAKAVSPFSVIGIHDAEREQTEQFAAFFVINYILENQESSEVLSEFGAVGLSLIAAGQNVSKKIQQEGIRMICSLHQMSFECAASYTLLLSDEILSNVLARKMDCLNEVSAEVLLHMRQLGYLILENWDLWNQQVLLPTKNELKSDFEAAMSKEDFVVDLDFSNTNGTNECQNIISKAFNSPLGQQVSEVVGNLKSAWLKTDEGLHTKIVSASTSTINACENQYDDLESESSYRSNISHSHSLDDWVTYTDEPDSKFLASDYSHLQAIKNNQSYIEEIDDTECDSLPCSEDNNGEVESVTSEDESDMSNFSDTPVKYSQSSVAADGKTVRGDGNKNTKTPNKNEDQKILQIEANASLMRKIIQKYQ